jgi:hypothetical protein
MSTNNCINVEKDFTDAPGARYRLDGPKSGQEFLEDLLEPRFLEAVKSGGKLLVDLDGTWGYASSFISATFGALSQKYGASKVNQHLALKSDEDSILLEKVMSEINQVSEVA